MGRPRGRGPDQRRGHEGSKKTVAQTIITQGKTPMLNRLQVRR
ncbi:MAG: hypothetical protein R3A52_18185 [Polyangiales bacterium]